MDEDPKELLRQITQCFVNRDGWHIHNSQSGWVEVSEDLNDLLLQAADLFNDYNPRGIGKSASYE